jgi:hypothetical protein
LSATGPKSVPLQDGVVYADIKDERAFGSTTKFHKNPKTAVAGHFRVLHLLSFSLSCCLVVIVHSSSVLFDLCIMRVSTVVLGLVALINCVGEAYGRTVFGNDVLAPSLRAGLTESTERSGKEPNLHRCILLHTCLRLAKPPGPW